jgi:hypothetical protein
MKLIPLSQGKFAQVDDEDFEYLNQWKWHYKNDGRTGYAVRNLQVGDKRTVISMHVAIMGKRKGLEIDHRDSCGTNNQRNNLRFCTHTENVHNAVKMVNVKSRYKGAYDTKNGWEAVVSFGKRRHLGYFPTELHAAICHDMWATFFHREFAKLNFPQET